MQVEEMLPQFPIKEFHPFPRGLMGPGAHEIVGPEALKLGFKKTLVMTSGLRGSDIVHKITESLKYHGLEVVLYDKVESNPKDYNVMDAVGLYQQNECDSFISIGGGSSHDACDGARISVAHDGRNVTEFEGFNKSENPKNPPHIAISTTAGTGSETSWAYVITDTTTDPDNPHKYVAFDDASVTTLAIDDPVLYYSCPLDDTAQCGFDVLAHASEPYVSRINFQTSLGNALHAIKLTSENLREAVWNPQSLAGREGMMYAQYIAAQAFNSGGLGRRPDRAQESVFFSERFLAPRPLLESVRGEEPSVLLIDEVDRADEALEAVLLETLAEFQVSVPEVGTFTTKTPPYVILTSNNTRDLSAALKRRCLHLFLDYPSAERELEIVRSKETGLPDALAAQLVDVVRGLRDLELRKAPSISETIDWARTLAVLGVEELTASVLSDTASVVVKYDKDVRKAIGALPRLVDPNAVVPEHGHGHGHGHGHDGDHTHGPRSSDRDDADEIDGRAVRAAKDTPGRFGNTYGSNPLGGEPVKPPKVPAERGSRSFGAGLGRKRAL